MIQVTQQDTDVLLDVKVVPKSSRDRIVGEFDGMLKVTVSAAPERGAANQAVCRLLAETLGLRRQQVSVDTGHASPRKTIRISRANADDVRKSLSPRE